MPGKNTERIKIYVVIGLSLVFGMVGYFRFFFKKAEADVKPIEQVEVPSKIDLSSVQPIIQGRKQLSKELSTESFQPISRDIFTPLTTPKRADVSKMQSMNKEKQKPHPRLRLKGTIVGGERPIAVGSLGRRRSPEDSARRRADDRIVNHQHLTTGGRRSVAAEA